MRRRTQIGSRQGQARLNRVVGVHRLDFDLLGLDTDVVLVFTTVDTEEAARSLARLLIEQRLAASVQVEHIRSTYRWKGTVQKAPELRLMAKNRLGSLCAQAKREPVPGATPALASRRARFNSPGAPTAAAARP